MLLTIPAVVSCVVTVLALFVGVATIAVSTGPGWRELRWFGIAAICASAYGVAAFESTLDVPPDVRPFFGRLGGSTASLLLGSWYMYFAARQRRRLARWERAVVIGTVVNAIAWLIPGVCRTSEVFVRTVPWLSATYTTTRPTALGQVMYLLMFVAVVILLARAFLSWRRGQRHAFADFLGISVQLVAGVNDSLAASGRIDTPYLLDIGQFAVVIAVGTTLIARFVSDARALERSSAQLRAAQTELVRNERLAALGELSAVVAHEVRNPVTVIFSAVSTLRKQPMSPEASTLLDIVNEEAERLKHVVGELLDFARPRNVSVDAVAPKPLVEGAVEAALAAFGGGRDLVALETEQDLPEIAGDEQLLRQALINLITNALQAPGRTGKVGVHIHVNAPEEDPTTPSVTFDVQDDGTGISKEVAEKLFTPFFTTRASGTGLGLAIVKRIAEAHGGDISWRPGEKNRGVTFTLRIPTTRASHAPG